MVKISNIYLSKDKEVAGCAFLLNENPNFSKKETIDNWSVEIKKKNPFIVAKYYEKISEKQVVKSAFNAVQKFLDICAFTRKQILCTEKASDELFIYYKKAKKNYLKIIDNTYFTLDFKAKGRIIDKNGKIIKQKVEPLSHYNFMRYFRISQATDDVFESFRYLYLAFENLISSTIIPH